MSIPIRVLIIEDSEDDAALIMRELRRGGYNPHYQRVETRKDMIFTLQRHDWDIIISDYSLPRFNGLHALEEAKKHDPDIPFIIVSGNIGEETAVEAMRAGAHDYLMKDNLKRLLPAVERELREHHVRIAQKRSQQAIHLLTRHDHLTGLINRKEFERRIHKVMSDARRDDSTHALCYLDLDQFKIINDTCGHTAGDELLKKVSIEIQHYIRDTGIFSRIGGDEFGLLLPNITLKKAKTIAERIRKIVYQFRFNWEGNSYQTGVSIGMVMIDSDSSNVQQLISAADVACFAAKELGRNRLYIYERDDALLAQRHGEMLWASKISRALKDDRLLLYAQPITSIHGTPHLHHEVLLRMINEDGQIILPDTFIPAAERYNLMPEIDRWVIKKSFSMLSNIMKNTKSENFYSINLSGNSLGNEHIQEYIRQTMQETGINPRQICFEITETAAIANLSAAVYFINTMKKYGFRFALDDFGSGLSSFSYLKNLPVDYLKIDGSFVKGICNDSIDYAMVEAINRIGHIMGLKTIAEFVSDHNILKALHDIGVDYAQGYAIGKPAPLLMTNTASNKTPAEIAI